MNDHHSISNQLKWFYDDACDNLFFLRTVLILSLTGIGVMTTWLPDGPVWLIAKMFLLLFSIIPLLWYDRKMESISLEICGIDPETGRKI